MNDSSWSKVVNESVSWMRICSCRSQAWHLWSSVVYFFVIIPL